MPTQHDQVINIIKAAKAPLTPKNIADLAGIKVSAASSICSKLYQENFVRRAMLPQNGKEFAYINSSLATAAPGFLSVKDAPVLSRKKATNSDATAVPGICISIRVGGELIQMSVDEALQIKAQLDRLANSFNVANQAV